MKTNKNNSSKQSGFTIVELLIVIVVIGILAAITIVAYSGITNRANKTKALTNGTNIVKVVEAYNADSINTGYPGTAAILNTYSGTAGAIVRVPSGLTVLASTATALSALTDANKTVNVTYLAKGTTGGCIGYWDFTATTPAAAFLFAGDASAATTTTCT